MVYLPSLPLLAPTGGHPAYGHLVDRRPLVSAGHGGHERRRHLRHLRLANHRSLDQRHGLLQLLLRLRLVLLLLQLLLKLLLLLLLLLLGKVRGELGDLFL